MGKEGGGHFSINKELGLFCAQQAEVAYLSALLSKSFCGMVNNRLHCWDLQAFPLSEQYSQCIVIRSPVRLTTSCWICTEKLACILGSSFSWANPSICIQNFKLLETCIFLCTANRLNPLRSGLRMKRRLGLFVRSMIWRAEGVAGATDYSTVGVVELNMVWLPEACVLNACSSWCCYCEMFCELLGGGIWLEDVGQWRRILVIFCLVPPCLSFGFLFVIGLNSYILVTMVFAQSGYYTSYN